MTRLGKKLQLAAVVPTSVNWETFKIGLTGFTYVSRTIFFSGGPQEEHGRPTGYALLQQKDASRLIKLYKGDKVDEDVMEKVVARMREMRNTHKILVETSEEKGLT